MLTLFATCPKGLELLLRDELRAIGADDAREALAGVHFSGSLELAYRACLWSRLASRILVRIAEFEAMDADALYAGVQAIDWSTHLAIEGTFAVDAVSGASAMTHTQYIALRSKDAAASGRASMSSGRRSASTCACIAIARPSRSISRARRCTGAAGARGRAMHR
jgi:23S rRNA (guanine2445-N2)-methyltransferase / 23S rRNA (guanine2069-N7)-methyltransferase